MTPLRTVVFFLLVALAPFARALDAHVGANCDLGTFGVDDNREFLRFDRELRAALDKRDAAALSLLVQFPLRVSLGDDSAITLQDAPTLQKMFDRVFTPKLRAGVKAQTLDDLICKPSDGIGYFNGSLWAGLAGAGGKQFRLIVVNSPDASLAPKKAGDVEVACVTKQFRIVVDAASADKSRYRAWTLPHSILDKPDLELVGSRGMEGTSPCTSRYWRFDNKGTSYEVSQGGCGQDPSPQGARAHLDVAAGGVVKAQDWCF
jgi:hypothetical protein